MTIFDKHRLNIAQRTLQMSEAMANALGMSRETARQILEEYDRKRNAETRRDRD